MAISRKTIEELTFTTKKGKYYVGEEVDAALDTLADEVEFMQNQLSEAKERLETYASQTETAKTWEQHLQQQFKEVFIQMQSQLDVKKQELKQLTDEVEDLRREKEELARKVSESLRKTIENQEALLAQWEVSALEEPIPESVPEEAEAEEDLPEDAEDLPEDTEDLPVITEGLPEDMPPLPFPDAEEVAESDVWNL